MVECGNVASVTFLTRRPPMLSIILNQSILRMCLVNSVARVSPGPLIWLNIWKIVNLLVEIQCSSKYVISLFLQDFYWETMKWDPTWFQVRILRVEFGSVPSVASHTKRQLMLLNILKQNILIKSVVNTVARTLPQQITLENIWNNVQIIAHKMFLK